MGGYKPNFQQPLFDTTQALCAQTDPELFFPEKENYATKAKLAKRICNECPLVEACLTEAIVRDYTDGIWGGSTPAERKAIVRKMKKEPNRPLKIEIKTRVVRLREEFEDIERLKRRDLERAIHREDKLEVDTK